MSSKILPKSKSVLNEITFILVSEIYRIKTTLIIMYLSSQVLADYRHLDYNQKNALSLKELFPHFLIFITTGLQPNHNNRIKLLSRFCF